MSTPDISSPSPLRRQFCRSFGRGESCWALSRRRQFCGESHIQRHLRWLLSFRGQVRRPYDHLPTGTESELLTGHLSAELPREPVRVLDIERREARVEPRPAPADLLQRGRSQGQTHKLPQVLGRREILFARSRRNAAYVDCSAQRVWGHEIDHRSAGREGAGGLADRDAAPDFHAGLETDGHGREAHLLRHVLEEVAGAGADGPEADAERHGRGVPELEHRRHIDFGAELQPRQRGRADQLPGLLGERQRRVFLAGHQSRGRDRAGEHVAFEMEIGDAGRALNEVFNRERQDGLEHLGAPPALQLDLCTERVLHGRFDHPDHLARAPLDAPGVEGRRERRCCIWAEGKEAVLRVRSPAPRIHGRRHRQREIPRRPAASGRDLERLVAEQDLCGSAGAKEVEAADVYVARQTAVLSDL